MKIKPPIKFLMFGKVAAGILLLILGISGIILPVLPGWPFVILAIILLGLDTPILLFLNKNKTFVKYYQKYNNARGRRKK